MSYDITNMEPENKKVSVVIPVYNREKNIKRSLKSALNQTYSSIEVIVVDDGSTDRTYEVVSSMEDDRICIVKLNKRYGVSKARNIGIKISEGDFIAFLDSDDEWVREKVEKQMEYIKCSEKRIDIVDCDWYVEDRSFGTKISKNQCGPTDEQKLLSFQHICSPPTVIARRSALEKVGAFDESISTAEDADLWVRLSQHYEFGHVPEALVKVYRGHRKRLGRDVESFLNGHLRFYIKHKDKYKGKDRLKSNFFMVLGRKLMSMGELSKGRSCLVRSIKLYRFNITNYLLVPLTFMSKELYEKMAYIKNKYISYLEGRGVGFND